jgi:hypothetical protein
MVDALTIADGDYAMLPTRMKISAMLATSLHSGEHIAVAERPGYDRVEP